MKRLVLRLQVSVGVPVRMAHVHAEPRRVLPDGGGEDRRGAAERPQQQEGQEEEEG